MNTPSLHGGNWRWRFDEGQLNNGLAAKLALLAELSDRIPESLLPRPGESYIA